MSPDPVTSRRIAFVLLVWCASALLLGATGVVAALRPPFPQVILFGLVALLLLAYRSLERFRRWIFAIPIAWLVAVHLTRFVGFYFLWLFQHGQLPFAFAVPGGCGDIVVASLALLFLAIRPASPAAYLVWNTLGLADILFVVITAARLAFVKPESMATLLQLPLSLLPTFVVPLLIFSHLVIFFRISRHR